MTGGAVGVLQLITKIALESNVATSTVIAMLKGVRDAWPKRIVDADGNTVTVPPVPDAQLTQILHNTFAGNSTRNSELQAEIRAGNIPPAEG